MLQKQIQHVLHKETYFFNYKKISFKYKLKSFKYKKKQFYKYGKKKQKKKQNCHVTFGTNFPPC